MTAVPYTEDPLSRLGLNEPPGCCRAGCPAIARGHGREECALWLVGACHGCRCADDAHERPGTTRTDDQDPPGMAP